MQNPTYFFNPLLKVFVALVLSEFQIQNHLLEFTDRAGIGYQCYHQINQILIFSLIISVAKYRLISDLFAIECVLRN